MDHRPFEDWLLENKALNSNEKRQLNEHLRSCTSCSALAEVDLALKTVKLAEPAAGFTGRFQVNLEARKQALRRRNIWGFFILTVSVLGVLAWFAWPFLSHLFQSPVNMLASWLTSLLSLWAAFMALLAGGQTLLKVVPGFVPGYVWMILLVIAGGWSLIWVLSIMKFVKLPQQGVQQ
jgi:hypothetical protein